MLVLTRKANEAIVIEGGIRVTVLKIRGSQVQLGIDAPKEVVVRRAELDSPQDRNAIVAA